MPHRVVLSLLDEYDLLGLDKKLFKDKLHHLGDSFNGFYRFCSMVNSFKPLQCNQLLYDRLNFILTEIRNGSPTDISSLDKLIERSWSEIPCSRYSQCQGHKFDPHCEHRR